MAHVQKYQKVVSSLVNEIFLGKLKPETKLPTEKQLSAKMKVDRTSLRLGLKQLESMKVLSIRQGDGIYVRDYLKNAGLDFLGLLLQQEDAGRYMIEDIYLMDEIWEFWIMFFPMVVGMAIKRGSTRDLKSLAELIALQEKSLGDRKRMVELGIAIQDRIAEVVNNTLVLLLFNSCRPMRKRIMEIQINSMDRRGLKDLIDTEKSLLKVAINGSEAGITQALARLRGNYESYRRKMRESMGEPQTGNGDHAPRGSQGSKKYAA
jgi:GntR family transcriptional repressor for pyruvate dehydrogenase complex